MQFVCTLYSVSIHTQHCSETFLPNAVSILAATERSRPCLKSQVLGGYTDTRISGEVVSRRNLCIPADEAAAAAASASQISGMGVQNKETSAPYIR